MTFHGRIVHGASEAIDSWETTYRVNLPSTVTPYARASPRVSSCLDYNAQRLRYYATLEALTISLSQLEHFLFRNALSAVSNGSRRARGPLEVQIMRYRVCNTVRVGKRPATPRRRLAEPKHFFLLFPNPSFWLSIELYKVKPRIYARELAMAAAIISVAAAGYYFTAPEFEVPYTGRKYRRLVPPELSAIIETTMAEYMISEAGTSVLPPNHPLVREVVSVGNVLTDANGLPRHEYIVIDSEEVNAFVVGGNIVFVYTGILPMLENVSGIAMVLGHEMGHVLAGHMAEGLVQVATTLAIAISAELFGYGNQIFTELWAMVFQLPRQRHAELEADEIGYALMSTAGFDRREASNVFTRTMIALGEEGQEEGDDWAQTHPIWPLRIALLQNMVDMDTRPNGWVRLPHFMPINFHTTDIVESLLEETETLEEVTQSPLVITATDEFKNDETTPSTVTSVAPATLASSNSPYSPYSIVTSLFGTDKPEVRERQRKASVTPQSVPSASLSSNGSYYSPYNVLSRIFGARLAFAKDSLQKRIRRSSSKL